MTQATTHNTNTPRRAPPVAVRAASRSRGSVGCVPRTTAIKHPAASCEVLTPLFKLLAIASLRSKLLGIYPKRLKAVRGTHPTIE